ncbi:MAG: histidine--tRNA ligase [Bradyrhizobiaceae bacterium]|nr:histidine--tRNA ligase [Bradyrhizobiaceae bacterium]
MNKNPKQKSNKIKARLPRGLADRGPAELAATREMIEKIRAVYERYGFEAVETPAIEYTDALGKFLPDQDRPNEGVFSFQDDDEQWLSLRYDLTAPLARYVAENFQHLALPYRSYRYGWVFRNEKPGPGRFRQFMQFDADTVGAASVAADAEMCMLAADTMEELGLRRQYVVKVNSRKLLDGILDFIGLSGEDNFYRRLIVLRAVDKYDRLGWAGVKQLLGDGRQDESGDFTKGAGLSEEQIAPIQYLLTRPPQNLQEGEELPSWEAADALYYNFKFGNDPARVPIRNSRTIETLRGHFNSPLFEQGLDELDEIAALAYRARYGSARILVDTSVVRGLEYYTGPVYEAELTFEVKDEKGRLVRFGSVAGGGRYDGLIARFTGQKVPATGFSIGVSRLLAALQHTGKIQVKPQPGPVIVTVMDKERMGEYQGMVKELRDAGIRAELYLGNPKNFPNQLKYADKRNSPCVVIQGSDERHRPGGPVVTVKDLMLGSRLSDKDSDRAEHLRRQSGAQMIVPREHLVPAIIQLLLQNRVIETDQIS